MVVAELREMACDGESMGDFGDALDVRDISASK